MALLAFLLLGAGIAPAQDAPVLRLEGGFATRDEVVNRFVAALEANDEEALLALLVSRTQYRDVFIPGTVEPGQPLRTWSEKSRQYFTESFFEKSRQYARVLLKDWGGRKLKQKNVFFTREAKTYATYTAHGELRVEVESDPAIDHEPVIRTGYLAEINGTWKFIGFLPDDD